MTTYTPAIFEGAEVTAHLEVPQNAKAQHALEAFLALTLADRSALTRHVWAYYEDTRQDIGADELDTYMPRPDTPEQIWRHVRPTCLAVIDDEVDWYVMIECNSDWETEHGLELSMRHGTQIAKVGPFNSHPTNEWAYDDKTLIGVVYKSRNGPNTFED